MRIDSARASAFVRDRCREGDAVIGTLWEHAYYFRRWTDGYQPLLREPTAPETPAAFGESRPASAKRLWLLATGKTACEREEYLQKVQGSGPWIVRQRHPFVRLTVFLLTRAPGGFPPSARR
jgi:hypothetical protein